MFAFSVGDAVHENRLGAGGTTEPSALAGAGHRHRLHRRPLHHPDFGRLVVGELARQPDRTPDCGHHCHCCVGQAAPGLGPQASHDDLFVGLIHGFGFAGVLQELELPTSAFVGALLQFNLGLELGQVTIVAAVAGLLFLVRERAADVPCVIRGGSMTVIAVAVVWFIERTADLSDLSLLRL